MLKAFHIPGKMFGNLTVPSEATFTYIQSLESHFMCVIESAAHLRNVCDVLYHHLSRIGFLHLCSEECQRRFLKMFCRVRLCWHVRFINRNLEKVWFHSSVAGAQLDKFKA